MKGLVFNMLIHLYFQMKHPEEDLFYIKTGGGGEHDYFS